MQGYEHWIEKTVQWSIEKTIQLIWGIQRKHARPLPWKVILRLAIWRRCTFLPMAYIFSTLYTSFSCQPAYLDCCDEDDGSFFTLTVSTCPGSFFSFGSDVDPAAPPPRWAANCALWLRLCNLQVISSRHKSTFYANYLLRPFRHSSGIIAQALMIYFQPDKSDRKKREFACNLAQLYPRTTGLIYV